MAGITRSQVFAAADAISAAGQGPTVASIRAKLGTGSYTTITALLRDWKTQVDADSNTAQLDVPEEVNVALSRAAEIVWKAATDHFAHELATVKKEADRNISESERTTTEALIEIERLEANQEQVSLTIAKYESQIQALEEAVGIAQNERNELAATLRATEERIKEQGDLLRRLMPNQPPSVKAKSVPKSKKPLDQPPQSADR